MNTQITQIAERLRALREALDLTVDAAAAKAGVSAADYSRYESGEADIPMSFLIYTAQALGVDVATLISGDEPRSSGYFLTRKGTGPAVERRSAYKYQSLASGFRHAKAEPFEVTVEPDNQTISLNSHAGQEFNYITEGSMQLNIGNAELVLNEGDCIYFDASKPHGMKALNGARVRFLAVVIEA
jgi:transcriptional regulator with XRE-family HTH domain